MAKHLSAMICFIFSICSQASTSIEDNQSSARAFLDSEDSIRLYASLKGPTHSYETSDETLGIHCSLPKERDLGSPLCYATLKIDNAGATEVSRDENMLIARLGSADADTLFNALDFEGQITRYGEEKYFRSSDMWFSIDCRQEWVDK